MPHKCTKCGREYKDGSTEILKGCGSCGNKKFLYVREEQIHEDVLEEKPISEIAEESKDEILEVVEAKKEKREIEVVVEIRDAKGELCARSTLRTLLGPKRG